MSNLKTFVAMFSMALLLSVAAFTQQSDIPSLNFEHAEHFWKDAGDTTVVVNFWATWCAPCVKELPAFEKLNTTYAGHKVKVVLVSLDFKSEVDGKLPAFVRKKGLKATVIHLNDPDANGWIPKVDEGWSGAIPATLIIHPESGRKKFMESALTFEALEEAVKEVMTEP
ncbi:MAG: redoxin domain-containing protein [Flavobacteriales bacterium]|nr:redoxin domain-containing protein [Flavobacteriales bacterium]